MSIAESRYVRLTQMGWWRQDLIANGRALVAGCGALGNEVIKNLALLGWGLVVAIDFDHVEANNLTRSIFFTADDLGRSKVETIGERAARVNPSTHIVGIHGDLRQHLSAGLVERMDLVFGCLDGVAPRLALSQLAGQAGCLHIDGALSEWEGTVSVFAGGAGTCYACTLSGEDVQQLGLRRSCPAYMARAAAQGGVPTTPTVASLTAAHMVQIGLRWLHGQEPPALPVDHQIRFDTQFDRMWRVRMPKSTTCTLHPEREIPADRDSLDRDDSWRVIHSFCCSHLGSPAVALHLPITLLESWNCMHCGMRREELRPQLSESGVECSNCGRPTVPRLRNQITGDEPFIDSTPAAAGLPPWSWIRAVVPDGTETLFELAGAPTELALIQRSATHAAT